MRRTVPKPPTTRSPSSVSDMRRSSRTLSRVTRIAIGDLAIQSLGQRTIRRRFVHAVEAARAGGRHDVRRIARQQHATCAPLRGHACVEGVDHFAQQGELRVLWVAASNPAAQLRVFQHGLGVFAGVQHELVAHGALRARQADGRALREARRVSSRRWKTGACGNWRSEVVMPT